MSRRLDLSRNHSKPGKDTEVCCATHDSCQILPLLSFCHLQSKKFLCSHIYENDLGSDVSKEMLFKYHQEDQKVF